MDTNNENVLPTEDPQVPAQEVTPTDAPVEAPVEAPADAPAEKRFCSGCGTELRADQLFCPNCGMKLDAGVVANNEAVEEFNRQLAEAKKKKKKRSRVVLLSIVAVIVLAIVGRFAFIGIRHSVGLSQSAKAVESYRVDKIDYNAAVEKLTKLKASKDDDVAKAAGEAMKTVDQLKESKDHFKKAEECKGKEAYQDAVSNYAAVIKDDPNYEKAQAAIQEILPLWKKQLPGQIDKLLKDGKTDEAKKLIKTFTDYSDDKDIKAIEQFIDAESSYQKGYLNTAKDAFSKLPGTLTVNGVSVSSRLETLKKYDVFVRMCGKWNVTKYYRETKEVWSSGRWNSWYSDGTTNSNYGLEVTCVINKDGTVTVSGTVDFCMYTNYSSISSNLNAKFFDSSFSKKVSLPSNGKVSFDFVTGEFTRGSQYVKDSQKLTFEGGVFKHSISIKYLYSQTNTEYYTANETFGKRAEKY